MRISYPLARMLGSIAEAEAVAIGVGVVIAVVDAEGGLLFYGRMDGALPVSSELAMSKAYTAAALRMATHEVGRLAQPGGVLYGIQHTHPGNIVLFGGGLPLKVKDRFVGAVGISGGTVEEDIQIAEQVAGSLEQMASWSERIKELLPNIPLEMGSASALENRLKEELEKMHSALPTWDISILTSAILMAASEQH